MPEDNAVYLGPFSRATTTDATAKTLSVAGLEKIKVQVYGADADYVFWPQTTNAAKQCDIGTAPVAVVGSGGCVWLLQVPNTFVATEGLPIEIRQSNGSSNRAYGLVKHVTRFGQQVSNIQQNQLLKWITVVLQATSAAIVSGDQIWLLNPSTTQGVFISSTNMTGQDVAVPGWAQANGVLAFVRNAGTDASLAIAAYMPQITTQ